MSNSSRNTVDHSSPRGHNIVFVPTGAIFDRRSLRSSMPKVPSSGFPVLPTATLARSGNSLPLSHNKSPPNIVSEPGISQDRVSVFQIRNVRSVPLKKGFQYYSVFAVYMELEV